MKKNGVSDAVTLNISVKRAKLDNCLLWPRLGKKDAVIGGVINGFSRIKIMKYI